RSTAQAASRRRGGKGGPPPICWSRGPLPDEELNRQPRHWVQCVLLVDSNAPRRDRDDGPEDWIARFAAEEKSVDGLVWGQVGRCTAQMVRLTIVLGLRQQNLATRGSQHRLSPLALVKGE
ncbi:hypothetical protein CSHISOI_07223, partial [Colletotrichum shisoi]